MTSLAAVLSAVLAFIAAALAARWMIPKLQKKGFSRAPVKRRGEDYVTGLPAPALGGLPVAAGLMVGVLVGLVLIALSGDGALAELTRVSAARALCGLLLGLLMGAVGLLNDYRGGKGLSSLSRPLILLLQAAVGICYLMALILCGDRSTLLVLPFWGQADLGGFYHPLCLLLILGAAAGGEQAGATDGTAATTALGAGLSLGLAGGILGSAPGSILGFSLAGGALGLLLYSFPPAKLRCGKGGGMLFGGMAAAAAMGCGSPALLIPAALPWLLEGIFALARVFAFALTGKRPQAASLGGWLEEKGFSSKAVTGMSMAVSLVGFALTAVSALKL